MPVTDLFEEYRNDVRWVKSLYLPAQLSLIDVIFAIEPDETEKQRFKKEETRLFNLVMRNQSGGKYSPVKIEELTQFGYEDFVSVISADFMSLPQREHVFKERVAKFFQFVKTWTKTEHLNVDLKYLENYIENPPVFNRIKTHLTKNYIIATSFPQNQNNRLKILSSNLAHESMSKMLPKVVFITSDDDLGNDPQILKTLLDRVISQGLLKLPKNDQPSIRALLSPEFVQNVVVRSTSTWGKLRAFQRALNKGVFETNLTEVADEGEFYNLHRLLPLVFGPTSLNFKYFRKLLTGGSALTPALQSEIYQESRVTVAVVTTNLGGHKFTKRTNKFSNAKLGARDFWEYENVRDNDIIILGFQEIVEVKSKNYKKFMFGADKDHLNLSTFLHQQLPEFDSFYQEFHGPIGLMILVKRSRKEYLDLHVLKTHRVKLGFMGLVASKGIIGCELLINNTRHVFFNAHLAAGETEKNLEARLSNFQTLNNLIGKIKASLIAEEQKLGKERLFLMGDLNFRSESDYYQMVRKLIEYEKSDTENQRKIIQKLLREDQLQKLKNNGEIFGFREEPIWFLPTYKFKRKWRLG